MYEFSAIVNKRNKRTVSPVLEHIKKEIFFQPKLTINQPNDLYEQEAEAMADKVMRTSDTQQTFFKPTITNIQRKCAHCEEEETNARHKATKSAK